MRKTKEPYIHATLTVEEALTLYNALPNPVQKREFFGNLPHGDAKRLQPHIQANHRENEQRCNCYACTVYIE